MKYVMLPIDGVCNTYLEKINKIIILIEFFGINLPLKLGLIKILPTLLDFISSNLYNFIRSF